MVAKTLVMLITCIHAPGFEAGRTNDLCCEEPACVNKVYGPTQMDDCCGAVGYDCDGVTQTLIDAFNWDVTLVSTTVGPDSANPTWVDAPVSVGSILHDLCCVEHPYGAFCNSDNQPVGATLDPIGDNSENDCACMLEWRKAAFNVLRNRQWTHRFPYGQGSWSCLDGSAGGQGTGVYTAKTYLPKSMAWAYEYQASAYEHKVSTVNLKAPAGTELDCPKEDDDCKVGTFNFNKDCFTQERDCRRRNWLGTCKEWSPYYTVEHSCSTAGDAAWCSSGKFASVHYRIEGSRWGVCK